MNNEVKLRLSLVIPGATMLSSQECDKNPKENYEDSQVVLSYTKKGGKRVTKSFKIKTRKCRTAKQNINICEDCYKYMLNTPSDAKLKRIWNNLPKGVRLKHHFDLIANDLNAISYSYEMLD